VLHALVLAADALVVVDWAKDLSAEQSVTLGLEGAVVDGLGGLHLPMRPGVDVFGRGDLDADGRIVLRILRNLVKVFYWHRFSL
jgi:hypothetical protein